MKTDICKKAVYLFAAALICLILVTSCGSRGVTSYDDGECSVDITMEGGSGKAYIHSPVTVISEDGALTAVFVWSSVNYDYMLVDGVRYDNENVGGESTFTIPIDSLDEPLHITADTVAMSKPHEIDYIIYWDWDGAGSDSESNAVGFDSLARTGELELKYAEEFNVIKYGAYSMISIGDDDFLLVPENADVPNDIPTDITVLKQPLDKTYLVSSSVMDFIRQLDCMGMLRMSATKADEWSIGEARAAMENGDILYAGKYRAPDYELLLSEGCNFAIENTMIYHEPSVKEKLEELGIPVMVERSSYESHPLGRLEWIKLYGVLYDKEQSAIDYFNSQLDRIEPVMEREDTGVTAAFFHVTSNGLINVRKPGDYVSKMIELSGGRYIIEGIEEDDTALSTMNMQMEDFYAAARDADVIIYNSTIDGELQSIDELIDRDELFADFKAVSESEVYCMSRDMFQQTTGMAEFMNDLNAVFTGTDTDYTYLTKLE